jgi:SAM-dependent methyltransferase
MSTSEISSELAELYDLDCGAYREDIPYYRSLARKCSEPILELGVGTGRVAVPLAESGLAIWGLDASPAMLARARCRADARAKTSLHLIEGRLEDFDLEPRFGLAYAAFGTLHHLIDEDAIRSCMRLVARHLAPGGTFACDLRPLHFEDWEEGDSVPLFHDWSRPHPRTGDPVMKFRAVRNNAVQRIKLEAATFDLVSSNGTLRRLTHETALRYFAAEELKAFIVESGMQLEGVYGGYRGEPYSEDGDHMIVVARTLKADR